MAAGRRARRTATRPRRPGCRRARSASATSRFALPGADRRRCSTASTSPSRPARRWRSSARTAPARPRSPSCCAASTTRSAGAIEIDGVDLRDARPRRVAVARSPRCSRTSSATSCRCATTSRPRGAPDDVIARRARATPAPTTSPTSTPSSPRATPAASTSPAASGSGSRWPGRCARCALGAGVVLLDEPTAQLDVRGEAEIFERVLAATRHCTTILVSHRFSTVRQADRICVVEHGRVVELGTPRRADGAAAAATARCSTCRRRASSSGRRARARRWCYEHARLTTCRPRCRRCGAR